MKVIDAALRLRPDREGIEHGERTRHRRPTGETVERDDAMTAVHRLERLALSGLVRREIRRTEHAAARTHVGHDRLGDLAAIEHLRAVARDALEREREIGLNDAVRGLRADRGSERRAARPEEDAARVARLPEALGVHREGQRDIPVDLEPFAREPDRRLHYATAGQRSIALEREAERSGLTRDADRRRAVDVRAVLDRGPEVHPRPRVAADQLEHVGASAERSARAAFYRRDGAVRAANDKTGNAADAARKWLDDAHHERGRDRGVDGVPAVVQHLDARLRGEVMLRRDHAATRDGFGLGVVPLAADVGAQGTRRY